MLLTLLTAFLALCGCTLASVATGLARWAKYASTAAPSIEFRWGLWNFLDVNNYYCDGWVIATTVMIILAACFFLFTLIVAILVLASKTPWRTKPLRLAMVYEAFLTFTFAILAICFWIAHCEWPNCWMGYSGATWADVNSTFQYTKYDISFFLACAACGVALLMCLTACCAAGKTPKPPPAAPPDPLSQLRRLLCTRMW